VSVIHGEIVDVDYPILDFLGFHYELQGAEALKQTF
jgi:hypothetical protein